MNTLSTDGRRTVKPFWPPMAAGIALGLALLFTFLITGHGLGASGAATDVVAGTGLAVAPAATQANLYLASKVADGNPIGSWMTWEVLGLFIGALVAAFMAGRFRVQLDGARSVGATPRLVRALAGGLLAGRFHVQLDGARSVGASGRIVRALAGGLLAGFGARVAGGCTSGLGLSGAAALGIAAFVFLALFFATGLIVNRIVRGV